MNRTASAQTTPSLASLALLMGVFQLVALLGYGLMLDPPRLLPFGLLTLAPIFVMTLLTASVPRGRRPTEVVYAALLPIAVGLVVLTLLIGTFVVPDSAAWWVAGAVLSSVPFLALARLWAAPATSPRR